MTTIVDTNVVIAALQDDHNDHEWSVARLVESKLSGPTIVPDIVYSELAYGIDSKEAVDLAISSLGLERLSNSDLSLFRAGLAFKKYRNENKGPKTGLMPDFLIGALAECEEASLLTVNARDYVNYFPGIDVISPKAV